MTCATIRDRLLAMERPDRPAAAEAHHLAGCPACRAWLRRLVRLERSLPLLPVPPSAPPAALIEALEQTPTAPDLVRLPDRRRPEAERRREGGRQKLALAFSLAAALFLFAVGWWLWPHRQDRPLSPEQIAFQKRVQRQLASAHTPAERVGVLADLASTLLAEARAEPGQPDKVARLARDFDRLVRHDLQQHATLIPLADRDATLSPIATRLGQLESEASRLHAEWSTQHVASAGAIEQIARAARAADLRLRALVRAQA